MACHEQASNLDLLDSGLDGVEATGGREPLDRLGALDAAALALALRRLERDWCRKYCDVRMACHEQAQRVEWLPGMDSNHD